MTASIYELDRPPRGAVRPDPLPQASSGSPPALGIGAAAIAGYVALTHEPPEG